MIRKTALAATMAALLTPAVAGALGLGNIEVGSALNEPLAARIPLRGANPGEFDELRVLLADEQQFRRAGLDRVFVLSKLRFEVVETGNGNGFIRVSTREPIAEPFLNFLVDVNWPRGRVLREYTVLLDPPVYGAAIASGSTRSVRTVQSLPEPAAAPAPAPPPRVARPAAASPAGSPAAAPRWSGDRYGPVREGETLWSIAERVRAQGVSIQSTMLALLRANPEAFSIDNVNALRTGAVLRIPPASEIAGGKAAALAEVSRQHALWEEYRQSSGAAVSAQPGAAPPAAAVPPAQPGGPAPPAAVPDAGTPASELKLVGAGTAGAATGGGADVAALRNELTMAQEESEAAKRENEELQSRLSEVETLVDDLKRLVELKEDQLAALQDQLAMASEAPAAPVTPPPADTSPEGAPAESPAAEPVAAATGKPAESPPEKPAERAPPPPPPKSMLDEAADLLPVPLWTIPAALGALLVALGGMRFARRRKARAEEEAGAPGATGAAGAAGATALADDDSDFDAFAPTAMPMTGEADDAVTELPSRPAPDDGTVFDDDAQSERTDPAATTRTTGSGGADEEDPLAEVNVYLAYERFDQAEQLVRDAIGSHPERPDYRLKLLEVFYAAKNVAGFEAAAAELQSAVGADHAMMQQAREWWGDLGAGHELFADAGPSTEQRPPSDSGDDMFDVTASDTGEETGVDFDLGFESDETRADGSGLDFDLGASDEAGSDTASDSSLDFDLGSLGETAGGAAAGAGTGLDFDLGADDDDVPTRRAGDDAQGAGTGLDFDLDAGAAADAGERDRTPSGTQTADDGETGLDFDLGGFDDEDARKTDADGDDASVDFDLGDTGTSGPASTADRGDARQDAAGDDDSALDFDLGDTLEAPERSARPGSGAGTGADSMADSAVDFDLGDTLEAPRSKADGTSDEGVGSGSALDFDLGDTHEAPRASEDADDSTKTADADSALDFDLGDTHEAPRGAEDADDGTKAAGADSALDFDLGDTHETPRRSGDGGDATEAAGQDSALDFDLGDTQTMDGPRPGAPESSSDESVLDFDLGDTGGDTRAASGESQELDFDIGAPDSGDEDEPLSLDMNLEDTGAGDADRNAAGAPDLTLDMEDTQPSGRGSSIDTVKLSPGDVSGLQGQAKEEEAGAGSGFGVDTEFRDIFGGGGEDGSPGQASELDFDLGSADPGTGGGDDLESTQFSLRDDSVDGGDDDEDHTLVLGRGASGEVDEMQTKLDLAQAYMDMGDSEGARNLLGEVMAEGDDTQKGQAREMLQNLG